MFLLTDTILHKQTAHIICKAFSDKAQGILETDFDIYSRKIIVLRNIVFVPFDHCQNVFIDNLCEGDLTLIKTNQGKILLDTVKLYNTDKRYNAENASRDLQGVKLKSDLLFTSRLFIEDDAIWLLGIYDTDNEHSHILLAYKSVGKKFKPTKVEVIKKGG